MVIIISSMRRPGEILDSSKLAILSNKLAGSIRARTKGIYIAKATIKGRVMKVRLKTLNERGKYVSPTRSEQTILAGRVSNFLNNAGVSHDIKVT